MVVSLLCVVGEDGPPNTDGTRGGAKLYILIGISFDSEATTRE